jgi:hypothetical protein
MLIAGLIDKVAQEIIKEQVISTNIAGLVSIDRYSVSLGTISNESWQLSYF